MSETKGSELYSGCQLFKPFATYVGLPLYQINLFSSQFFALVFSIFFRKVLSHRKVSVTVRHYASLILGLLIGFFFIGEQIHHLFVMTTLSYIAILTCSPKVVQKVVLIISLSHLSYMHILRVLSEDREYNMDITGQLMVAVQRMTNIGFSLNDGLTKTEEELTAEQNRYAIRKRPTILEFFSYSFQFQSLIFGPLVFYNDYIEFINGHNFERHIKTSSRRRELPSALWTVVRKLLVSIIFVVLFLKLEAKFPVNYYKANEFLNESSFFSKMAFVMCQTLVVRFMYYFAFLLSEAICISSGLGFDGFDSVGNPVWDLVSNVDVFYLENSLNFRTAIESWNKTTQKWVKRTAFDRIGSHKLLWTYLLSSVWHGFHPGYYLMFSSWIFFTIASRYVRRSLRHRFQSNRTLAFTYDCLTYITTRVFIPYMIFPFFLLEFWASIQVYKQLYFFGHILGLIAIFILPRLLPPEVRLNRKAQSDQE